MINPFRWIIDFFKFIWEDTVSDFEAVRKISDRMHQGKPAIEEERAAELKAAFKQLTFRSILAANWGLWLMMALSLTVGWWWASQYYQVECNNFIFDTYIEPQQSGEWHAVPGSRNPRPWEQYEMPLFNISAGVG